MESSQGSGDGEVEDLYDMKGGANPEAKALNNHALGLSRQGQYSEAEAEYQQAIRLDPSVALYYYNLAITYGKEMGTNGDKVVPTYLHAKSLAPRNLAIRQNLGKAYCDSQRYEEAVAEFREMLRMDPTWNMARPCLAGALRHLGRTKEAEEVEKEWRKEGGEGEEAPTGVHM
jgi:tetratricopeptide (TPR) repeat protein